MAYTEYESRLMLRPKVKAPVQLDSCLCMFNSFLASGNFCHLLITFANSFDSDQDRQNVGPDLDPNCLTNCFVCLC